MLKTADQNIEFSDKIGGTRVVFEGHPSLLIGGFDFNPAELPTYPNVLPAGTPIKVDEQARTIEIHYAFEVTEKVSATKYKVKKGIEGSRAKEGMFLMVAPATAETTGTAGTIKSIDATNEGYDEVTFTASFTAEAGDVLVEAATAGADAKVKVVPNALTDRDKRLAPGAKSINGDAVWACDRPILERRIPAVAPAIKKALAENECYFRWSNRM